MRKDKDNRLVRAKRLLNKLKHQKAATLWSFFHEKNFDQDQKVNPRNDRWLCRDPSELPTVMHTKFPATVMVVGVVSSEGDVILPRFCTELKSQCCCLHRDIGERCEALDR